MPITPESNQSGYEILFASISTALAEIDLRGTILRPNTTLCLLAKASEEELLDTHLFRLTARGECQHNTDDLLAEMRSGRRNYFALERQLLPNKAAPQQETHKESQISPKNGEPIPNLYEQQHQSLGNPPAEKPTWVKIKVHLIEDYATGAPSKAIAIIEDITARKSSPSTQLDEPWKFFQQAFYSSVASQLLIDPSDGHIVDTNAAAESFYNYSKEQLQQMYIQQISTLSAEEIRTEMAQAESESRLYFRFRHRIRNGEIRDVEVFSNPIWLHGRRLLHSIIHDVTEIRRYQRRLEVYRELFRTVPVGIYRTTPEPDGRFLEVNPAMLEMFEAESEEQLLAIPVRNLYLTPQQREEISARLNSEGMISGFEAQLQTLHGRYIWTRLSLRKNLDEHGQTVFDGLIEDISERIAAERFQRQILHSLAEGVMGIDTQGRHTFLNPAACNLLGYSNEQEALGKHSHSASHHTKADGSPFPVTECPIYQVTKTGQPLEAWEDLFWRTDGSSFPVLVYAAPIRSEEGSRRGVVVSFQDITERQRAQRERDRMLEILDDHPHFIQRFLPNGTIVFANRALADLLGCSVERLIGSQWWEVIPTAEREALCTDLQAFTPEMTSRYIEHSVVDAQGDLRWIEWSTRGFFDDDHNLSHFQSVGVDITQRKAAEQARRQAEQDRSTFFAGVSHDLRTPLNAILGFTELLKRTPLDETQYRYLDLCQTAGDRLLSLIETILDLSRLEAGRLQLHDKPFELRVFLEQQFELLREHAEEKGLRLNLEIDSALPDWVVGDATRFGQVIFNLTINAINFTSHGSVSIELSRHTPEQVMVTVRDTGPGIAPEHRERIFEAFIQAGDENRRREGSGLGLKICRELVNIMGGEIYLESELGQGSTFYFTARLAETGTTENGSNQLERAEQPPSSTTPIDDSADQQPNKAGADLRVLIAEDEPVNALLARKILEGSGCYVLEASDGQQAIETWQKQSVDLLLLDVQMPVLDGPQTAAKIRQLEHENDLAPVPIAMLTAHAIEDVRDMCISIGCDYYLTKPIDLQALNDLIRRVSQDKGDSP